MWHVLSRWATISFSDMALILCKNRPGFRRITEVTIPRDRLHGNFVRLAANYKRQCHALCTIFLVTLWALFWSQMSPKTAGNTDRSAHLGTSPETSEVSVALWCSVQQWATGQQSGAHMFESLLNNGSLFPSNQKIPDRQIVIVFTELLSPWS
jgi:hypothetical protein